eukprot:scaffold4221_cov123-Skeletonema_marinoi.AAC.1
MLGCNVDVFGITSKLKEAHLDIFDSTSRAASLLERLFGDHAIMPTQLASTVVRRNEWATHD